MGALVMSENRCCYWLKGLLIGGLAGIAVGLLYAPKSGKETRSNLGDKAANLAERMKEEYEVALEKSKSRYESLLKQLKKAEVVADEKAKMDTEGS
jgi:gas vesicle protein